MRVSVVIPSYNYGRFVGFAVESVLNQTVPVHEVLVVDDGSTDDTAAQLRPYMSTAPVSVRHLVKPNGGVSSARNWGVERASGDLIAFLDADDTWHPSKLELQLAVLQSRPDVGLVGSEALALSQFECWSELPPTPPVYHYRMEDCVLRMRFCPSSFVVRRSVAVEVGLFDSAVNSAEDRDYLIRCAAVAPVACVGAPLVFYRVHPASATFNSARMIGAERAVLDKAFALPALRDRVLLRRRAYGLAHMSASYMLWRDSGRPRAALSEFVRSFTTWPLPFRRGDTKCSLYRLRFGARLLPAAIRGR